MTAVGMIEEVAWVLGVGALVLVSPWLPNPLGFAAAVTAIVLGPGHGLPDAIFRAGSLTFPERLLFIVLTGIAIVVTTTYLLLKLGVRLDQWSVSSLVVSLTGLSSAVRLLGRARQGRHAEGPDVSEARWRRAAICGGILLGVICGTAAWRIAGL